MKLGKAKLKRILSKETGIPIRDIGISGQYIPYSDSKEQLILGGYTLTALNGKLTLCRPVYEREEIGCEFIDVGGEEDV